MKSAGKARNNGLYRHIRTSKEIIRNLLNDSHEKYPSAKAIAARFVKRLTFEEVDKLLDMYTSDILSEKKNQLIRRYLKEKLCVLREAVEGR